MNWFEKVRDNYIPIERLFNKFFYTDKVGALLLQVPYQEMNQETALVNLLSKGFSKYHLLKLYKKQQKLELYIQKQMSKYKVYDPNIRKYVQVVKISFGQGIEYLLLGEILERDFGFRFEHTPEEIAEDNGRALCEEIEQVMNRIGAYFTDKNKNTLKSIQRMIKEQQLVKKLEDE